MPDPRDEQHQSDDRKVPVQEKAWARHLQAAEESEVEPHPKAEVRASRGP